MSTAENLKAAFAGESQANRKYLAFAKKADEEGFSEVAKLFRAAADAETVHALSHLAVLGEIKSTTENLEHAIDGETAEFEHMYPKFIAEAEKDQDGAARVSFARANKVERIHSELYKRALADLGSNERVTYYVCQVCGNTVADDVPAVCPVCGQPKEKFRRVD